MTDQTGVRPTAGRMSVLVVGGTGVLGAAVAAELRRHGHRVTVLSRHAPATESPTGARRTGMAADPTGPRHADTAAGPANGTDPADGADPLDGAGSAGGADPAAGWVGGDVRLPGLGLAAVDQARLAEQTTHIVSCFGSVAVAEGPRTAIDLHLRGTQRLIEFARACPRLHGILHVSSILVFGRCPGTVGNHDLRVGQSFRNWYEYGKFLAETAWQEADGLPVRVLRLGPVLGADGPAVPDMRAGILRALPAALSGLPLPIAGRGDFPCYVTDNTSAAELVRAGLEHEPVTGTWTWYDPRRPTLNATLTALCSAWGVLPRIVPARGLAAAVRLAAPVFGLPRELCDYLAPWPVLAADILDDLPVPRPTCPDRYVERTGKLLREHSLALVTA